MSFQIKSIAAKRKKSFVQKVFLIFVLGFILICSLLTVYVVAQVKNVIESNDVHANVVNPPPEIKDCGVLGCVGDMLLEQGCNIKTYNDRTNVLLLGMGGLTQEQGGENLTDTIIVASISHKDNIVSMISIPRDLWVQPTGIQPNKINTLYKISQSVYEKENGYVLPKSTLEELLGIPIHYYVVIDFQGFVDVIDALGGVKVNVEKSFIDYQYPDGKYGYMNVEFEQGINYMGGERALQYVRSRHATSEGGDFSRSKRQQNLLSALKEKLLSFSTIFKLKSLTEAILNNYDSNVRSCEVFRFASLAKDIDFKNIKSLILDDGPGGVLYTPTQEVRDVSYDGQYILLPDGNNYNLIKEYVNNFLNVSVADIPSGKVAVMNGTGVEGLANTVGAILTADGIEVIKRSNTTNRVRFMKTVLYDTSGTGQYIDLVEHIQTIVGGELSKQNYEPMTYGADVILIIGADYKLTDEL